MSIELVIEPPSHLILCHPLLLLPLFPSIKVFSNELAKVLELQLNWMRYKSPTQRFMSFFNYGKFSVFISMNINFLPSFVKVRVAQLCPTLCESMDYTVHRILQARILEWVAFPFSSGSSQPRNRTRVACRSLQVDSLPTELSGKPLLSI